MNDESRIMPEDFHTIVDVQDPQISPNGRWIAYVRSAVDRVEDKYKRSIWLVSTEGGAPKPFTAGAEQDFLPRWSPDGKQLAFVSTRKGDKPQIYIIPVDGGEARALTDVRQGVSNPAWSPDGKFIAFTSRVSAEERDKEDCDEKQEPPGDAFEVKQRREAEEHQEQLRLDPRVINRQPYRAGTEFLDGRHTHLYVIATAAVDPEATEEEKKPRRITDGDIDYAAPIWSADGASLLTSRTRDPESNAPWIYQDLYRVSVPAPGEPRSEPTPLTGPGFSDCNPRPSPDGKFIAYLRQPEERIMAQLSRLAVIPVDGGEPRDVAPDFDRSVDDFRWSPDGQSLVLMARDEGDTHLSSVPVAGGVPVPVVRGRREVVAFDAARDTGQIGFVAAAPDHPPDVFTASWQGDEERRLTEVNSAFLARKQVMPVETVWYTAPDGVDIQGWVIKPPGFDATQKYPLAVEVHGGPHAMWGPSTRTMWHEWQCLAARGYVVFHCNPRGSDGYGYAFRDAIHSQWGEADMPDILSGVNYLVEQGYIDTLRMAVTGGSYGGFMTSWVVGHDQRFAAAVSQRGVYHLASFFGTTDIPELIEGEFDGRPWDAYEHLWRHSPLSYVEAIHTPLLIIHSERDFRVPIPDAEQLFLMLRWLGRPVEFVRYPREGHELSRSGEPRHRVDRLQRILGWFDKYCREAPEAGSV